MKLRDVLYLNKDSLIDIDDSKEYTIAGVQSYGKGVINRRNVKGDQLKMKKYKIIKENQLMWCKVDTKNGAFGITKQEHIGSLASTNMSLADINLNKANPEFIQLFFTIKPFYEYINSLSTGTTNRKYLTPDQVLDLIEVPSLSRIEQDIFIKKFTIFKNRIIGFDSINSLNESYISKLRQAILQEAVQGKLVNIDMTKIKNYVLGDMLVFTKNGYTGKPNDSKKGTTRLGIETVTQSKFININIDMAKYIDISKENKPAYFAKNNDIFVCRQNGNLNYVGKAAVYFGEDNKVIFSDSLIQLRPKLEIVDSSFLAIFLNSRVARTQLDEFCSTTAGNFSINGTNLKKVNIPLPQLSEQKRIVEKVDKLMAYCDELEKQVKENQANSKQLMEAVLSESFEN